jgi:peptide chain release factor 1
MFESVDALIAEYAELQVKLGDPAVHADAGLSKKLNRRFAVLSKIIAAHERMVALGDDLAAAKEMAGEDAAFAEEVPALENSLAEATEALRSLLIPRDPDDGRDVIMEIKGGEGGEESALFAADLLRMYLHYAESRGWKTEVIDKTESDMGGFKNVQVAIKSSATDPADGVWASMKYEGGVHRVQRVPVTESQGRIHTSTTGVLVFPEVDEPEELDINPNDLKIDVFRSSGPGGQSVNTTDSAVRITHLPTGIVVSMQNEKSQIQNREAAMRVLRARILAQQQEEIAAAQSDARKSQIRGMDRSERIRTYNFPENRIADHRTGFKSYNLDQVINGALDAVIKSCVEADEAEDLCSGSGVLAIALARAIPHATVHALELSDEAMPYLRRNVADLAPEVQITQGSVAHWASEVETSSLDLVVSNPPYVPDAEIPNDPEVQLFDPALALYGGEDGLDVVRVIVEGAFRAVRPGGVLMLEHSNLQGAAVRDVLEGYGFRTVSTEKDLVGRDRFTQGYRP